MNISFQAFESENIRKFGLKERKKRTLHAMLINRIALIMIFYALLNCEPQKFLVNIFKLTQRSWLK